MTGGPGGIFAVDIASAKCSVGAPPFVNCDCDILLDSLFLPAGPTVGFVPFNIRVRACGEAEATASASNPEAAIISAKAGESAGDTCSSSDDTDSAHAPPLVQLKFDAIQPAYEWRLSQESIVVDEHFSAANQERLMPTVPPTDLPNRTGRLGNDGFAIDLESISRVFALPSNQIIHNAGKCGTSWMSVILRQVALKLALDADTLESSGRDTALVAVGVGPTSNGGSPQQQSSDAESECRRGVRVSLTHCPALKVIAGAEDVHVRGKKSDIVRELRALFADVDKLKTWWPGPVDDLACVEGLEVLHLLEDDVLTDDPEHFRKFALSATINATLRRDADRRDIVLSVATAHSGLMLDAQFYARDLILDAVILGFQIHHRRLQTAVNEEDFPKAELALQPPTGDDLKKRFAELTTGQKTTTWRTG